MSFSRIMKLSPYLIKLRKKGQKEFLKFDEIPISKYDDVEEHTTHFKNIIKDFLENNENDILDEINKTITVKKIVEKNPEPEIYGIIKSGEFGLPADFYNVETRIYKNNARESADSELFPFFYHFYSPSGKDQCILILQSFSTNGIKSVLHNALNLYLEQKFYKDNFKLSMTPIVSKDALEKIQNSSELLNLRLIRHDMPKNPADRVKKRKIDKIGNPDEIIEEHIFYPRPRKKLHKEGIVDLVKGALSNNENKYYEVLGEKYDEMKVLTKNRRSKTLAVFGPNSRCSESWVLEDSSNPSNPFPECEDILRQSNEFLVIVKNMIGDG